MTLNYSDGWAPAESLAVAAEFRNQGMSARLLSGHIGDLLLESGDARFPGFDSGELKIHANAHGDAASALDYLRTTPLAPIAEHAFACGVASRPLQWRTALFFPSS